MRFQRQIDTVAIGLVTAVTLVGMVLWSRLPAELAIHWRGGEPVSHVAKPLALGGIWALGVGAVAVVRLAPSSVTNTPGGSNVTVLFVGVVIAWAQTIVLIWNLGYRFEVWLAMVPVVIAAGVLIVYTTRS